VLRGGSFHSDARSVRCAYRSGYYPDYLFNGSYGFRVMMGIRTSLKHRRDRDLIGIRSSLVGLPG
jgi:hypothetical protein